MKSPCQISQREKERKVFNAFSSFYGVGSIIQIEGQENAYPDGVLSQNGQVIAIEQTDYYYYKTGKASSYKKAQFLLLKISKQLSNAGYKGCVGIRLSEKTYSLYEKELFPNLKESIEHFIDNPDTYETNPLIENIHYCKKKVNKLVIRDFACDLSPVLCKVILPDDLVIARIREKEEKLKKCDKAYSQHWLIISIPLSENIIVDTRDYEPINTLFDKIYIQEVNGFEELRTEKPKHC